MCYQGQQKFEEKPAKGTFKKLKGTELVQTYVWTEGMVWGGEKNVMVVRVNKANGSPTEILFKQLRFLEGAVMKFDPEGPSKVYIEAQAKNIMATMPNGKEVQLKEFIDMAVMGEVAVTRLSDEKYHIG